jgi:hypothetical protein
VVEKEKVLAKVVKDKNAVAARSDAAGFSSKKETYYGALQETWTRDAAHNAKEWTVV